MHRSVWKSLKDHKSSDLFQTHVSLFGPPGKFCLDRNQMEKFWNEYSTALHSDGTVFRSGVAEKPQHYLPILVDVDIAKQRGDDESLNKIYTLNHAKQLAEIYRSILKYIIDDIEDHHLICAFMQKKPYSQNKPDGSKWTKHGFHLHFPYIFLNRVEQESHLIPRVKSKVAKAKIFEDIGFNDSASLIDTSYCNVPWLVYGGRKAEDKDPYILSKVFDHRGEEIDIDTAFQEYRIFDHREQEIKKTEPIEYYLPRIFSIVPYGREIADLKAGLPSPLESKIKSRKKKTFESERSESSDLNFIQHIKKYKQLVDMLGDHRAKDRNEWMNIGWILYNIGNGCPEARDLWMDFSQRCSEKYDETGCLSAWEKMVKMNKGEGSLKYIAKADSPEAYAKFEIHNVKECCQASLEGSHYDIARALYEIHGSEYVCSSMRHHTWYRYHNHRWLEMEMGIFLKKRISTEIITVFEKLTEEIREKLLQANDDAGEKAMYEVRFKQVRKVMQNLKNAPFKANIMKEAEEIFYDPCFSKKLDKNPYLIGFKNGVYDMRTHQIREGSPDDYISLQMAIPYKKFTDTAPEMLQVKEFLEKVFPDTSVRDYFINTSSDVFVGGNQHKLVQVWSGEGDNAKSVTQTLFEKMLGEYAVKLPTSLIVGKRTQASAACPELVRAGGGVRFAVLQEPDSKDVINIGILKELSGNDTFFARTLFKEGGEITPMFKLILICNEPPQLPHGDKAVWNRIRVIPFESTFTDHNDDNPPPESFEEQLRQKRFPKDKAFVDKIPGMIEAFAYLLLEHRKVNRKRYEPEKVKMATEGYRKKNDIYRQYIEESIMDDDNKGVKLSLADLYASFKLWFKEAMPQHTIPTKQELCTYFEKAWGEPQKGKKWEGKRLRTLKDDVEDGEAIVIEANVDDANENVPL